MSDLNMVVLVKGVPDFSEGNVQFKEDNTLNRGATPTVLNPNDHLALEAAREVQVKHGGTVHLMTMGPPNYSRILGEAMGICGDHAYLISDIKFAAADTWATAHALMYAMDKLGGVNMVFAGFKSADGETGQTGPQTALLLDFPVITHVTGLDVDPQGGRVQARRVVGDEVEHCEAPVPTFIVTDPGFTASYRKATERLQLLEHMERQKARHAAVMKWEEEKKAKKEDLEDPGLVTAWNAEDVGADPSRIGLPGSPTIVRAVDPIPAAPRERTAKVLHGADDAVIEEVATAIATRLKGVRA